MACAKVQSWHPHGRQGVCPCPPPRPAPREWTFLDGTDLSLPGLTFTRKRPYTGRWSEVLTPGQEEYVSGQMSPRWRLRYMTRSCRDSQRQGPPGDVSGVPSVLLWKPVPEPRTSNPLYRRAPRCRERQVCHFPRCPDATSVPSAPWSGRGSQIPTHPCLP